MLAEHGIARPAIDVADISLESLSLRHCAVDGSRARELLGDDWKPAHGPTFDGAALAAAVEAAAAEVAAAVALACGDDQEEWREEGGILTVVAPLAALLLEPLLAAVEPVFACWPCWPLLPKKFCGEDEYDA